MGFARSQKPRPSIGFVFIFLVLGGEAARVDSLIDTQSFYTATNAVRNLAAAGHRARRDLNEANKTAMEHLTDVIAGSSMHMDPNEHQEVARGWLRYDGEDMYAIWRKVANSPGEGHLDLWPYKDLDADEFFQGLPPKKTRCCDNLPYRTMIVRFDDAVLMDQKPGGALISLTGQTHFWNYGWGGYPARETNAISPVEGRHRVKMIGDDKWVDTGSEDNIIKAWFNIMRTTQTVDTCLEKGTCSLQCTYVAEKGGCNSDFCKLEEHTDETSKGFMRTGLFKAKRSRCIPREGADEVRKGWEDLRYATETAARHVETEACVAGCKPNWELVSNNMKTINELGRQFTAMSEREDEIPAFKVTGPMRNIYERIALEAKPLSESIASMMSAGFDGSRKSALSPLGAALENEGCTDVPDGAIGALFMIDAAPLDKKAEAQANFQRYADVCPWFQKLTTSPDEMIKKNEELKEVEKQGLMQMKSTANRSALVQGGKEDYIPIAEIIAISLIVASVITILAGLALVIRGSFCSNGKSPAVKAQQVAHAHCKSYLQTGGPCWQSHMLPGIYIMLGGFVMLSFTGLACLAIVNAAAIPAAWEFAVAGVAKLGGMATLGAMAVKLKKWFETKDSPDPEEQYTQCMERLKDSTPQAKIVEDSPEDTIVGLNELIEAATIRSISDPVNQFRKDLIAIGVYDIKEPARKDWEELPTWKLLKDFEKNRVIKYLEEH